MAEAAEPRRPTSEEVMKGVDLSGKTVLITGTSSGLGKVTAKVMLTAGATVVCCVRNLQKMEPITAELIETTGNNKIDVLKMDLGSFASIRECAQQFKQKYERLDILVLNAGVMATSERRETTDGFEWQIGVNHLGHFLLTNLLIQPLIKAGSSRVVAVSSLAHLRADVDLEDFNYTKTDYDKWVAYGRSKTANIHFISELQRKYGDQGITAFAVHPGGIKTELGREITQEDAIAVGFLVLKEGTTDEYIEPPHIQKMWKTITQGAATQCWAATAPELQGKGGIYLEDCIIAQPFDPAKGRRGYAPYTKNEAKAKELWDKSLNFVGLA